MMDLRRRQLDPNLVRELRAYGAWSRRVVERWALGDGAQNEVPWDDLPLGVPGLGQVKDREIVEALSRAGYSITIGAVKAARKRRGIPSWLSAQKEEQK